MIISFKIDHPEDLDLLLRITKRLGIEQVEASNSGKIPLSESDAINKELEDLFGSASGEVPPFM